MNQNTAEEVYLAAVRASEQLRHEGYLAADQLHRDATDAASRRDQVAADADDARAYLYLEAEQHYLDRRNALATHFGQRWTSGGNAHADHALAFVAEIDPDGRYAVAPPPPPIGSPAMVEHHIGVPVARLVHNGRVMPEPMDRFATRPPTVTGDAAKRAATMTPKERAAAAAWVAEQEAIRHSPEPEPPIPGSPPPGLLADIAKALGR